MNEGLTLMTKDELIHHKAGEAITLATVMAIVAVAFAAVIIYRLFLSGEGKATLPGGWKFEWN